MTIRQHLRFIVIIGALCGFFHFPSTPTWAQNIAQDSVTDSNSAEPQQLWYGELDAGERLFRFVTKAARADDGTWKAELESIDEGRSKFSLSNFSMTEDSFSFELKGTRASYQGTFNPESREIVGQWTQAGTAFELRFSPVSEVFLNPPAEVWTGQINTILQKLDVQIRVYQPKTDKQAVFFDSISQNAGGFKATLTTEQGQVKIDVPMIGGIFTGSLNEEGDQIVGKWKQGVAFDLTLTKLATPLETTPPPPPARPQTPLPPFPYRIEQIKFKNSEANITLQGTLTLPPADQEKARFPVAVLISGSGPQDRDETIFGHKPFLVIADHLTRQGIAVLRYDERGVGESTGSFELATTADFAKDAQFAIEYLKQRPEIDPTLIGLIGHSEGGIVAPILAAENSDVAWIVMLAGTGVNGREICYSQSRLIAEVEGVTARMLNRQEIMLDVVFQWLPKLQVGKSTQKEIAQIAGEVTSRILQKEKSQSLDENEEPIDSSANQERLLSEVEAILLRMNNPWFRYFITFEPGDALRKVRCPVLVLNGGRDLQVDPKLNLPEIVEHLQSGENPSHKVVEFPELNHLFQTSQTGSPSEYEKIEETFSIRVLEVMTDWIGQQVAR